MLSIVFVSEHFWPEIGGLERSTERLGTELIRLGHSVHMVTRRLPGTDPSETRAEVRVTRYPDGSPAFTALAAEAGDFDGADVVCLFGMGHDPAVEWWQPILNARLAPNGVRMLKVGTDKDITERGVSAESFQRLDGVLCQTSAIAAEAHSVGVRLDACFPVRNGLDVADWRDQMPSRNSAREELRIDAYSFVVLGLGRFVKRKRFRELVRAFHSFVGDLNANESRTAELVLHGSDFGQDDGEEATLRREAAESGVQIRFVSPSIDARATLAAADVLVTLAEREGAPNVFPEAFAARCPVIATDLPGHRVYLTHEKQGLLVGTDAAEAATALRRLFESPQLRMCFSHAAAQSAWSFDISETTQDYLSAFSSARQRRLKAGNQ